MSDGSCCMRDHANAVSPWTCPCECHNKAKQEEFMADVITIEPFDTEAEALAFIEGLEYTDNDHISYEPPYEETGKWIVAVRQFA